jgi:hypothetical protein
MKLTSKDKEFLDRLKAVCDDQSLNIDVKNDGPTRMVLRKNYGSRIEQHFGMTRQGVRWRFQRLFSEIYVNAYVTILWVESRFGTHLRHHAMAIARERMERYQRANREGALNIPKPTKQVVRRTARHKS